MPHHETVSHLCIVLLFDTDMHEISKYTALSYYKLSYSTDPLTQLVSHSSVTAQQNIAIVQCNNKMPV